MSSCLFGANGVQTDTGASGLDLPRRRGANTAAFDDGNADIVPFGRTGLHGGLCCGLARIENQIANGLAVAASNADFLTGLQDKAILNLRGNSSGLICHFAIGPWHFEGHEALENRPGPHDAEIVEPAARNLHAHGHFIDKTAANNMCRRASLVERYGKVAMGKMILVVRAKRVGRELNVAQGR